MLNTATRPASSPVANMPGRLGQQATAATPVWQVTGSASCSCWGRSTGSSRRHSCRGHQAEPGPLLDGTLAQAQQVWLPSEVADHTWGAACCPEQHPPTTRPLLQPARKRPLLPGSKARAAVCSGRHFPCVRRPSGGGCLPSCSPGAMHSSCTMLPTRSPASAVELVTLAGRATAHRQAWPQAVRLISCCCR